jgi:hypothetical protein
MVLLNGRRLGQKALREAARTKIRHYRKLYINRPDPIAFMPVAVDTSGRVYDDFSRLGNLLQTNLTLKVNASQRPVYSSAFDSSRHQST